MASPKTTPRVCTYCPGDADTVDHVPAKNLFRPPRPSTLITVPSCTPCNRRKSMDDEYFRTIVAFRHNLDHPDAAAARDAGLRSLWRARARRFSTSFLATVREVEVRSAAGLYLGRAGGYDIDVPRLDGIVALMVMALFYHETGLKLPDEYAPKAILLSQLDPSATELHAQISRFADWVKAGRPPTIVHTRVQPSAPRRLLRVALDLS